MHGWGLLFFLLFLLVIFGAAGWIIYTQLRARREGLAPPTWKSYIPFMKSSSSTTNYPTPRSSGPLEWAKDQFDKLRNNRRARGAYEETSGDTTYGGARRGRSGAEDDAWDTRVGNEDPYGSGPGGYGYEEQELGLAPTPGVGGDQSYSRAGGGGDYMSGGHGDLDERGRTGGHSSTRLGENPFGDQHEAPSLRSVSPRPEGDAKPGHNRGQSSLDSQGDGGSPTSTRKSAFREGI